METLETRHLEKHSFQFFSHLTLCFTFDHAHCLMNKLGYVLKSKMVLELT